MYKIAINFLVCVLVLCVINTNCNMKAISESYGPYVTIVENCTICQGPKRQNLTRSVLKYGNGTSSVFLSVINLKSIKLSMVRVEMTDIHSRQKSRMLSFHSVKPCEHYMIAAVLNTLMNTKSCVSPQGTYNMTLDFDKIFKHFYPNHVYGKFLFKIVAAAQEGNVACYIIELDFKPKMVQAQNQHHSLD